VFFLLIRNVSGSLGVQGFPGFNRLLASSYMVLIFMRLCDLRQAMTSLFFCFLDHTHKQQNTTVCRSLDERSTRRRYSYWTRKTFRNDKHPCSRWVSNLQTVHSSVIRPTT